MSKWILAVALLAAPVFAQRARVDNLKSFRQDLAAAVQRGNLTAEEKHRYEAALQSLDEQRQARKSAMKDPKAVARGNNLKEENRAKLARHLNDAKSKSKSGNKHGAEA